MPGAQGERSRTWLPTAFPHEACGDGCSALYIPLPRLFQALHLAREPAAEEPQYGRPDQAADLKREYGLAFALFVDPADILAALKEIQGRSPACGKA